MPSRIAARRNATQGSSYSCKRSRSPYSQSKFIDTEEVPAQGKESKDSYEKRTWLNRVHTREDGVTYMPPMSLKKALEGASAYLGKIPGQKNATYTKRFKSGVLITDEIKLTANGKTVKKEQWEGEWLHLDAGGKAGQGGTRVKRCMPRLRAWEATATIYVIDEIIDEDVLERALTDAGRFVGVGRFRPEKGGFYGRFVVDSIETVKE